MPAVRLCWQIGDVMEMPVRTTSNVFLTIRVLLLSVASIGIASAQTDEPIRIGLMVVKTGPLAPGGIQMEQGLNVYLEEHGHRMAGRPVELIVADTGGSPAVAKTKARSSSSCTASMRSSGRKRPTRCLRSATTSLRSACRR